MVSFGAYHAAPRRGMEWKKLDSGRMETYGVPPEFVISSETLSDAKDKIKMRSFPDMDIARVGSFLRYSAQNVSSFGESRDAREFMNFETNFSFNERE